MGARFVGVLVRPRTATWLVISGFACAVSCSVFPDEAVLPMSNAGTAGGGVSAVPVGGASGAETSVAGAGAAAAAAGEAGSMAAMGGVPPTGVAGAPLDPGGAAPGGAGGGGPDCASPGSVTAAVTSDTWIESAKPNAIHGNDKALSVISGGEPRRALLQVALPELPVGAVLRSASLLLHLESNADAGRAARALGVCQLQQEVIEDRATWLNWNNAGRTWKKAGGDFGPVLASATVPAGTADTTLSFDVTVPVEQALSAGAAGVPFIVLETGAPPLAPAELAFTAQGGNASGIPALIVDYCEP